MSADIHVTVEEEEEKAKEVTALSGAEPGVSATSIRMSADSHVAMEEEKVTKEEVTASSAGVSAASVRMSADSHVTELVEEEKVKEKEEAVSSAAEPGMSDRSRLRVSLPSGDATRSDIQFEMATTALSTDGDDVEEEEVPKDVVTSAASAAEPEGS
ncbi:unnamed protein product, partial [Dibothriocephalus latus]